MPKKGLVGFLVVSLGFILLLMGTTPFVSPTTSVEGMGDSPHGDFTISFTISTGVPVAMDDIYYVDEDTTLFVDALSGVLVNDTDPDDDLLASQIVSWPSHGVLDFNVDGSFIYTPDLDFHGTDSFVYECLDGMLMDTATVTIIVIPENRPPVAEDDF